jgi:Cytochrome c554 and c-prime
LLMLICTTAMAADMKSPSSAEVCGDCHRAIEQGWKRSAHANAVESRLYQDALKLAEQDFGTQARKVCLSCHSPIAVMTGDLDLVKKVSWEGITCDYCHSIRDVSTTGTNPKADIEFSLVKSGPSKDSNSPVHMTRFSPVHTSSLVCITCHEYANSQGLHVLTTYSEWKAASYAKSGEDCQTCHMYSVKGEVVDPRVEKSTSTTINLHEIPGSHSIQQLNKAIKAAISAKRVGEQVQVVVKVTNQGAGHYVPTGSPLRQMILNLKAESYAGQKYNAERVYRRTVADKNGAVLNSEPQVFIKGAKVVSDTRLAPNQTKIEKFSFPMRRGSLIRVVASFSYYYSPLATSEQEQKVKFLELTSMVH